MPNSNLLEGVDEAMAGASKALVGLQRDFAKGVGVLLDDLWTVVLEPGHEK